MQRSGAESIGSRGRRMCWGRVRAALLASSALIAMVLPAAAQDATWNNPATVAGPVVGTFDFKAAANWTPNSVPIATAFFGASSTPNISFSANTDIGGWTFNAGASNYTFINGQTLQFIGNGIIINGGSAIITNNLNLRFDNNSTAASATITNNSLTRFIASSTAAGATITNNNTLTFENSATAGNAAITNNNILQFGNSATAGNAAPCNS
jgi:hypothetical protein